MILKLGAEQQDGARMFVYGHARALERCLYSYDFGKGAAEDVLVELAKFQNGDGGFGHALEPDLRLRGSSVAATARGLQLLRHLAVDEEHPLVQGAIHYLLSTYDADRQVWPIIPANVEDAPHAPWWRLDQVVLDPLDTPRAEILGHLFDYPGLVPRDLLDRVVASFISRLDALPDTMDLNNLMSYVRLARSSSLPADLRARVVDKIGPIANRVVARHPDDWKTYGLKPLEIVPSLDSPFAATFASEIEANLDHEIGQQESDGSWAPSWNWGALFPEAWEEAKREWKAIITIDMLKCLRSFGRLE